MDELSEDDKLTVARARKIQRFLSQPFQVAEVFTGHDGKLVPLKVTTISHSKMRFFCMVINYSLSFTNFCLCPVNRIPSQGSRRSLMVRTINVLI